MQSAVSLHPHSDTPHGDVKPTFCHTTRLTTIEQSLSDDVRTVVRARSDDSAASSSSSSSAAAAAAAQLLRERRLLLLLLRLVVRCVDIIKSTSVAVEVCLQKRLMICE